MRPVFIVFSLCLVACTTTQKKTGQKTMTVASVDKPKKLQPKVNVERDKSSPSLADYEQYFPYSNGRRWEWNLLFSQNGIPLNKSLLKESVVGVKKLNNGKDYFRSFTNQYTEGKAEPARSEFYKRIAKDGIYVRKTELAKDELKIPFPIKMGMTWTTKNEVSVSSFKVDRLETVKLNGREYVDCLKILRIIQHANPNQSTRASSYYAKGVGLVLEVSEYSNMNVVMRLELR